MKILVCGDRNWVDKKFIRDKILLYNPSLIIEGEADGADSLARIIGEELGIKIEKYPAEWNKYGKSAGPIRNQKMLNNGKPDLVLAFHDNIENSKGTKHMISIARKANIKVILCSHDKEV